MANTQVELEVIGGPDKGRIFRVSGAMTVIGRDNECHIRLNDPTISSKHARIEIGDNVQVHDLGSINKLQHNGVTVTKAVLAQGDRITIGDTTFEVNLKSISPLEMQQSVRTGRRRGGLLLVASSILLLFIFVYYGVNYQKEKQKQQTPLVIKTQRQVSTLGFRGLPQVWLPAAGDFSEPPTIDYQPKDGTGHPARPRFYSFLAPKAGKKGGYQDRGELATAAPRDFPPDPLSNLTYKARNWSNYPPRIGSGRFLKSEQVVLGNYYVALVTYTNGNLYNKTPPEIVGKKIGFDSPVGELTPLHFDFYIEVWDSLPTSDPIANLSLDLNSKDERFGSKPLVPKMFGATVDRARWTKQNGNEQWAEFTQNFGNVPYMHYIMRQEKKGEVLAIFTARGYDYQHDRINDVLQNLIDKQSLVDPKRKEDRETLLANALALEKEADNLIPDLMKSQFGEMEFYKEKWNYFRAFNRYHRALCLLQVIDKWNYDDDYLRIFAKAEKIYDYMQNENGFFIQTWKAIERLVDKGDWKGTREKNKDLYEITTLGMEPDLFPFLDEWFIYSHLVREKVAKNLIQEQ